MITASGVYDLTMQEYLGQPADALSMSSSDAGIITEATPAHLKAAWAAREDEEEDDSKKSDIGTVIHALLLEPFRREKLLAVFDYPDWRGNRAKDKAAARADGKTPILAKHLAEAEGAVAAVRAHPLASALLKDGKAEQSWFAKDPTSGLYRKARTDFYNSNRIIVDLKTVANASPDFLQRRVYDGGWFMQSPWHCDVVERVEGQPAQGYCWVIVEQKPPHCVVVRKPNENVLMHGHRLNQKAWATFARCAKTGQWPGYSGSIEDITLPSFALFKLEEEGVADEANPKRGLEALAWHEQTGGHVFS